MVDSNTTEQDPRFDWKNIDMCGLQRKDTPMMEPSVAREPKIPIELSVDFPPLDFLETYYVDGFKVSSHGLTFNFRSRNFAVPGWKLDGKCINVKLNTNTWQFIGLERIFSSNVIDKFQKWIHDQRISLLQIGVEYEKYERQIYHFLYELIALFHALENIPKENRQEILDDTKTATTLHHNRILTEIFSGYLKKGALVEPFPESMENNRVLDLKISNIPIDVKSILITGKDRKILMKSFAEKLRTEIIDRELKKQQIGQRGTFFIGIWSGIIGSILYTVFHKKFNDPFLEKENISFYTELPPLNEKKAIIVVPTLESFQNYYLVFERNRICDIVDYLSTTGYDKIKEDESMNYLSLNNIRKGCEFGVTGENPILFFKFR